jgi:hypothetical protein
MGKSVAERVITFILRESKRCSTYESVISLEQASSQVTTQALHRNVYSVAPFPLTVMDAVVKR